MSDDGDKSSGTPSVLDGKEGMGPNSPRKLISEQFDTCKMACSVYAYPRKPELQLDGSRDFTSKRYQIQADVLECDPLVVVEGKLVEIVRARSTKASRSMGIIRFSGVVALKTDFQAVVERFEEFQITVMLSGAEAAELDHALAVPAQESLQPLLAAIFEAAREYVTVKKPDPIPPLPRVGLLDSPEFVPVELGGVSRTKILTVDMMVPEIETPEFLCTYSPESFRRIGGIAEFTQTTDARDTPIEVMHTPPRRAPGMQFMHIAGVTNRSWLDPGGPLLEYLARHMWLPTEEIRSVFLCGSSDKRAPLARAELYGLVFRSTEQSMKYTASICADCARDGPIELGTGTEFGEFNIMDGMNTPLLFSMSMPSMDHLIKTYMPYLANDYGEGGAMDTDVKAILEDGHEQREAFQAGMMDMAQKMEAQARRAEEQAKRSESQIKELKEQTEKLAAQTQSITNAQEVIAAAAEEQKRINAVAAAINERLLEAMQGGGGGLRLGGRGSPAIEHQRPQRRKGGGAGGGGGQEYARLIASLFDGVPVECLEEEQAMDAQAGEGGDALVTSFLVLDERDPAHAMDWLHLCLRVLGVGWREGKRKKGRFDHLLAPVGDANTPDEECTGAWTTRENCTLFSQVGSLPLDRTNYILHLSTSCNYLFNSLALEPSFPRLLSRASRSVGVELARMTCTVPLFCRGLGPMVRTRVVHSGVASPCGSPSLFRTRDDPHYHYIQRNYLPRLYVLIGEWDSITCAQRRWFLSYGWAVAIISSHDDYIFTQYTFSSLILSGCGSPHPATADVLRPSFPLYTLAGLRGTRATCWGISVHTDAYSCMRRLAYQDTWHGESSAGRTHGFSCSRRTSEELRTEYHLFHCGAMHLLCGSLACTDTYYCEHLERYRAVLQACCGSGCACSFRAAPRESALRFGQDALCTDETGGSARHGCCVVAVSRGEGGYLREEHVRRRGLARGLGTVDGFRGCSVSRSGKASLQQTTCAFDLALGGIADWCRHSEHPTLRLVSRRHGRPSVDAFEETLPQSRGISIQKANADGARPGPRTGVLHSFAGEQRGAAPFERLFAHHGSDCKWFILRSECHIRDYPPQFLFPTTDSDGVRAKHTCAPTRDDTPQRVGCSVLPGSSRGLCRERTCCGSDHSTPNCSLRLVGSDEGRQHRHVRVGLESGAGWADGWSSQAHPLEIAFVLLRRLGWHSVGCGEGVRDLGSRGVRVGLYALASFKRQVSGGHYHLRRSLSCRAGRPLYNGRAVRSRLAVLPVHGKPRGHPCGGGCKSRACSGLSTTASSSSFARLTDHRSAGECSKLSDVLQRARLAGFRGGVTPAALWLPGTADLRSRSYDGASETRAVDYYGYSQGFGFRRLDGKHYLKDGTGGLGREGGGGGREVLGGIGELEARLSNVNRVREGSQSELVGQTGQDGECRERAGERALLQTEMEKYHVKSAPRVQGLHERSDRLRSPSPSHPKPPNSQALDHDMQHVVHTGRAENLGYGRTLLHAASGSACVLPCLRLHPLFHSLYTHRATPTSLSSQTISSLGITEPRSFNLLTSGSSPLLMSRHSSLMGHGPLPSLDHLSRMQQYSSPQRQLSTRDVRGYVSREEIRLRGGGRHDAEAGSSGSGGRGEAEGVGVDTGIGIATGEVLRDGPPFGDGGESVVRASRIALPIAILDELDFKFAWLFERKARSSSRWQPWVIVMQSYDLKRVGIEGWGVFNARGRAAVGDEIGRYRGAVRFRVTDEREQESAAAKVRAAGLMTATADKFLWLKERELERWSLVDGGAGEPEISAECPPTSFEQLLNDPLDDEQCNVSVDVHGDMSIARKVPDVRPLILRGWEHCCAAELRWAYGKGYWRGWLSARPQLSGICRDRILSYLRGKWSEMEKTELARQDAVEWVERVERQASDRSRRRAARSLSESSAPGEIRRRVPLVADCAEAHVVSSLAAGFDCSVFKITNGIWDASDLDEVVALAHSGVRATSMSLLNRQLSDKITSRRMQAIVLAHNCSRSVAGVMCYRLELDQGIFVTFIYELHLIPELQGKGLGFALFSLAQQVARESTQSNGVALMVDYENTNAIESYLSWGLHRGRSRAEPCEHTGRFLLRMVWSWSSATMETWEAERRQVRGWVESRGPCYRPSGNYHDGGVSLLPSPKSSVSSESGRAGTREFHPTVCREKRLPDGSTVNIVVQSERPTVLMSSERAESSSDSSSVGSSAGTDGPDGSQDSEHLATRDRDGGNERQLSQADRKMLERLNAIGRESEDECGHDSFVRAGHVVTLDMIGENTLPLALRHGGVASTVFSSSHSSDRSSFFSGWSLTRPLADVRWLECTLAQDVIDDLLLVWCELRPLDDSLPSEQRELFSFCERCRLERLETIVSLAREADVPPRLDPVLSYNVGITSNHACTRAHQVMQLNHPLSVEIDTATFWECLEQLCYDDREAPSSADTIVPEPAGSPMSIASLCPSETPSTPLSPSESDPMLSDASDYRPVHWADASFFAARYRCGTCDHRLTFKGTCGERVRCSICERELSEGQDPRYICGRCCSGVCAACVHNLDRWVDAVTAAEQVGAEVAESPPGLTFDAHLKAAEIHTDCASERAATRAATGSASFEESCDPGAVASPVDFNLLSWNLGLATFGSSSTRRKLAWLEVVMTEQEVDVISLQEVACTAKERLSRAPLRKWKTWFERLGFTMRALTGPIAADGLIKNCVVVAARDSACSISVGRALAERALGVEVYRYADGGTFNVAAVHGINGDDSAFVEQLSSVRAFFGDSTEGAEGPEPGARACICVGDWNRVICTQNRFGDGHKLSRGDKALRAFCATEPCGCCNTKAEVQTGLDDSELIVSAPSPEPGWTRFRLANKGAVQSPSAIIDMGFACGAERGEWTLLERIAPVLSSESSDIWLSDHKALLFRRTVLKEPVVGRPVGPAGKHLDRLRLKRINGNLEHERDTLEDSASLSPAGQVKLLCDSLASAVKTASEDAAERRPKSIGGRGRIAEAVASWKGKLRDVLAVKVATDLDGSKPLGVLHPANGLRRTWERVKHEDSYIIRKCLLNRCRSELVYWCRMARRLHRRRNENLMSNLEGAVKVCRTAPAMAEKQIRDAFRQSRGAAGLAMGAVFENDDPKGKRLCHGEAVRKGMGHIGSLTQGKFKANGVCPSAWAAFCDVFFVQQPEAKGRDGGEWSLRSELTWEVFLQALNGMGRGKALGADGVSIDWLRKAGKWVKRLFFDGLLRCAEEHSFPPEWGQIIYVLLRKKRGDQRLVHKRRDIALMAQTMKLLCKMTHAEAYLRISDSLHRAQVGWLCAHGATDAASSLIHVIQSSARLKLPLFILYLDLRTFFPGLHRQVVSAAELLHGLPREVCALVAKLFAVATGQYDSKHGLSDSFDIDWGALMGFVLSPDRAKLVLDLAAVAIALICKGAKVWGRADLRRILSILCADDWAGTFNEPGDMVAAWEMWKAWACASGCIIGVEELEKTTFSGIAYHADGRPYNAPCPDLKMNDGSKLARLSFEQVYKHMGFPRRLDGSMEESLKSFSRSWHNRLHALKRFRLRESDFIRASNIICLGLSSFYGTGLYLSWAECEKLEASWRNVYNYKFCRSSCSPRFPIYAEQPLPQPDEIKGGRLADDFGRQDGDLRRIHLYSALSAALLANSFKLLGDSCDSDARAATEQALGLAYYTWGCRVSPERWNPAHIIDALREYVSVPRRRNLGDCILLVYAECMRRHSISVEPGKQWDFWGFSTGGSPLPQGSLHYNSPIWTGFQSQALFEPRDGGGLGLPMAGALARAGIVQLGQLCERLKSGLTEGGCIRLCKWEKVLRTFPLLAAEGRRARAEWGAILALIKSSPIAQLSVDTRAAPPPTVWVEGHLSVKELLMGGSVKREGSSADLVKLRAWTKRVVDLCRVATVQEVDGVLRENLRTSLLDCLGDSRPANNSGSLSPYRVDEQKSVSQGTLVAAGLARSREILVPETCRSSFRMFAKGVWSCALSFPGPIGT